MNITEGNYLTIAMSYYDNSTMSSLDEFRDDLNRANLIQRQFKKYLHKNCLNTRLLINHFICFNNVFGKVTKDLLLFLIKPEYHSCTNSILFVFGFITGTGIDMDEELIKIIYKEIK